MTFDFIKQIDLSKLFQLSYIFEAIPDTQGLYQYLAIIFFLLIIFAFVLIIRAKKLESVYKKLNSKIINLFLLVGFFGLVLVFFRWQQIAYLGSRLMFLVLLAVFIIWAGFICWYRFFILPKEIEKYQKKKIFEKYLP